jgi:hypothetical protein
MFGWHTAHRRAPLGRGPAHPEPRRPAGFRDRLFIKHGTSDPITDQSHTGSSVGQSSQDPMDRPSSFFSLAPVWSKGALGPHLAGSRGWADWVAQTLLWAASALCRMIVCHFRRLSAPPQESGRDWPVMSAIRNRGLGDGCVRQPFSG